MLLRLPCKGRIRRIAMISCGLGALAAGCSSDDGSVNVLPNYGGSASTSTTGDDTTTAPATDGTVEFPVAYRFDCIDIQGLGDADETVLQAKVLENAWGLDIENFKLSIILEVVERDDMGGSAMFGIRSGVGTSASDQCYQPDTVTELIEAAYDPALGGWGLSNEMDRCSAMADPAEAMGGTYKLELGADDLVYIYAEDDDTTTFNCTPDEAVPDAVPIRAVVAEVTANTENTRLAGTLTGCLVETEAEALCSCLGECSGDGPDDRQTEGPCAGCPVGGTPLRSLLGNIGPSDRCTEIMGATAFDLVVAFSATQLPTVPTTCG